MNIKTTLALIVLILSCESVSFADDSYNFYFQKAPGSPRVEQGSKSEQKPDRTVNVSKVKKKYKKPRTRRRWWSFRMGYGEHHGVTGNETFGCFDKCDKNLRSYETSVISLGMAVHLGKYFDIHTEFLLPANKNKGASAGLQNSLGVGFTPLHISIFGRDTIELGLIAGAQIGNRYEEWDGFSPQASLYLGPRLRINFSDFNGIVLLAKRDQTYDATLNYSANYVHSW